MIFGKYINRYYLRYGWMLLLGLFALIMRCMRYRSSKIKAFGKQACFVSEHAWEE